MSFHCAGPIFHAVIPCESRAVADLAQVNGGTRDTAGISCDFQEFRSRRRSLPLVLLASHRSSPGRIRSAHDVGDLMQAREVGGFF